MSKKHYVVWKGAKTGVFDSWAYVKTLIDGRADSQYMGFPSKESAEEAFSSTYTKALTRRSLEKNKSNGSNKPSAHFATAAQQADNNIDTKYSYQIYCDGACSPNPGESGTGVAIYTKGNLTKLIYGGYNKYGTNNTAELNGILAAFNYAETKPSEQVQILSDSKYSIDCITKWAKGWKAKGWKRGKGEEIKNLDVIKQCFEYYQMNQHRITITHVKGHSNIEGNELSDRMAVLARMTKTVSYTEFSKTLNIKEILAMPSG